MSIITTVQCDHCDQTIPAKQQNAAKTVINQREYDLCAGCRETLLGKLKGKGRPVPPVITLTPEKPTPWVPVSPYGGGTGIYPQPITIPAYPGGGTGDFPLTPTITWQAGQPLCSSSAMGRVGESFSYTAH